MASAIGVFLHSAQFSHAGFVHLFARIEWTAPTYVHADDMPPGGETVIYPVRKPPKQ